ncbi:MAG: isoamylase early set domain-containing protein [Planctomycetota bacterium]
MKCLTEISKIPKTIMWFLIILGIFIIISSCQSSYNSLRSGYVDGGYRFVLKSSKANSVVVAGTFNDWSINCHFLKKVDENGTWIIILPLPPGRYQYMLIINGNQWLTPPEAEEYVKDGFGLINGVITIKP